MPVNKEEYIFWRNNPITRELMQDCIAEMDAFIAQLVMTAGTNPGADRHAVGRIEGLKFVHEWQPEFEREELKINRDEEEEEDES